MKRFPVCAPNMHPKSKGLSGFEEHSSLPSAGHIPICQKIDLCIVIVTYGVFHTASFCRGVTQWKALGEWGSLALAPKNFVLDCPPIFCLWKGRTKHCVLCAGGNKHVFQLICTFSIQTKDFFINNIHDDIPSGQNA